MGPGSPDVLRDETGNVSQRRNRAAGVRRVRVANALRDMQRPGVQAVLPTSTAKSWKLQYLGGPEARPLRNQPCDANPPLLATAYRLVGRCGNQHLPSRYVARSDAPALSLASRARGGSLVPIDRSHPG